MKVSGQSGSPIWNRQELLSVAYYWQQFCMHLKWAPRLASNSGNREHTIHNYLWLHEWLSQDHTETLWQKTWTTACTGVGQHEVFTGQLSFHHLQAHVLYLMPIPTSAMSDEAPGSSLLHYTMIHLWRNNPNPTDCILLKTLCNPTVYLTRWARQCCASSVESSLA